MQGSLDQPPIVVTQSRGKLALYLVVCVVFVAAALWLPARGGAQGLWPWAAIAFFGLGVVIFLAQLVRPGRLVVGPDGVTWRMLLRNQHFAWWQMRDFAPLRVTLTARHAGFGFRKRRDAAFGMGSFAGGWALSPKALCALLNAAHARWATD